VHTRSQSRHTARLTTITNTLQRIPILISSSHSRAPPLAARSPSLNLASAATARSTRSSKGVAWRVTTASGAHAPCGRARPTTAGVVSAAAGSASATKSGVLLEEGGEEGGGPDAAVAARVAAGGVDADAAVPWRGFTPALAAAELARAWGGWRPPGGDGDGGKAGCGAHAAAAAQAAAAAPSFRGDVVPTPAGTACSGGGPPARPNRRAMKPHMAPCYLEGGERGCRGKKRVGWSALHHSTHVLLHCFLFSRSPHPRTRRDGRGNPPAASPHHRAARACPSRHLTPWRRRAAPPEMADASPPPGGSSEPPPDASPPSSAIRSRSSNILDVQKAGGGLLGGWSKTGSCDAGGADAPGAPPAASSPSMVGTPPAGSVALRNSGEHNHGGDGNNSAMKRVQSVRDTGERERERGAGEREREAGERERRRDR